MIGDYVGCTLYLVDKLVYLKEIKNYSVLEYFGTCKSHRRLIEKILEFVRFWAKSNIKYLNFVWKMEKSNIWIFDFAQNRTIISMSVIRFRW